MKVAFINRPKSSWIGGDYIQMEKTAEALRKLGIKVTIFETPAPLPVNVIDEYDIVHLWNFTMDWTRIGIWVAKKHKKKTVCSMIYHEQSSISIELQQVMVDNVDCAIFLCENELKRAGALSIKNLTFIPNGIDSWWLKPLKNKTEDFVLTVGRIDGTKGQLRVAKECKRLGYRYVMVGEDINKDYLKQCLDEGVEYLGVKSGDELKELYSKCRVYVLDSDTEIMPLTVMEAGALNKPVYLTKSLFEFPGISKSIEEAWKKKNNLKLHSFVKQTTWDDVAKQIKLVYESL